jgi:hypothetical protein
MSEILLAKVCGRLKHSLAGNLTLNMGNYENYRSYRCSWRFSPPRSLYIFTSPLPLPPALPKVGIRAVLHEVRAEYAQIMTVVFLLVNGPGRLSLDALAHNRCSSVPVPVPAGSKFSPTALWPAAIRTSSRC